MPTSYTPLIIGIAGGSGSGKTTLANSILEAIGEDKIALLPHDAYYRDQRNKSLEERRLVNYDHPDSLETDLMIKHIQTLTHGEAIDLPVYDFKQQTRVAETVRIQPKPIILVEGILIFVEPNLRNLFSTDQDICFIRRLLRDVTERGRTVESVIDQYLRTVRPSFIEFVEPTKRFADVIIPVGGQNTVASDMVIARLKALLPD